MEVNDRVEVEKLAAAMMEIKKQSDKEFLYGVITGMALERNRKEGINMEKELAF